MHNDKVPVNADDALFLVDKNAETKPINQGVSKPRSAGQCHAAAGTSVNDAMNHKYYTIRFEATHTAYYDFYTRGPFKKIYWTPLL